MSEPVMGRLGSSLAMVFALLIGVAFLFGILSVLSSILGSLAYILFALFALVVTAYLFLESDQY